jgi:hypothetical protein
MFLVPLAIPILVPTGAGIVALLVTLIALILIARYLLADVAW